VASALGVPPLDVKVVPADTNRFGVGHGFNTTPSPGLDAAIDSTSERILAKARLLAGADLQTPPDELTWADGAFVADGQTRTIADVALYAHGSGALPPGVEGGLDAQTVFRD
jgi:carbon-monoxide dehydrogenase large subunit